MCDRPAERSPAEVSARSNEERPTPPMPSVPMRKNPRRETPSQKPLDDDFGPKMVSTGVRGMLYPTALQKLGCVNPESPRFSNGFQTVFRRAPTGPGEFAMAQLHPDFVQRQVGEEFGANPATRASGYRPCPPNENGARHLGTGPHEILEMKEAERRSGRLQLVAERVLFLDCHGSLADTATEVGQLGATHGTFALHFDLVHARE